MASDPFATEGFFRSQLGTNTSGVDGDRYRVEGELGRGGMGVVTQVWDRRLERMVACKRPHPSSSEIQLAAFNVEASVTALLSHPAIPPILDSGEDALGVFYTMPVLTGRTLTQTLLDGIPLAAAVRLVADVAAGVQSAHDQGVVHRDLKPDNLLVTQAESPFVLDWGVALDPRAPVHQPVGTPGYRAPEQDRGEPVDQRADVYSLGCILNDVLRTTDDDDELRSIAAHCLHTAPDDRYPNAGALARDLRIWLDGGRVRAHRYSTATLVGRWVLANRTLVVVSLLAVLGVATASLVGIVEQQKEYRRAETSLSTSESLRATVFRQRNDRQRAEWTAAQSLVHRDNPIARGVLAAWSDDSRPHALVVRSAECNDGWLQNDGSLVCLVGSVVTRHTFDGPRQSGLVRDEGRPEWVVFDGVDLLVSQNPFRYAVGTTQSSRVHAVSPLPGGSGYRDTKRVSTDPLGPDMQYGPELCDQIEVAHQQGDLITVACRDGSMHVNRTIHLIASVRTDSPSAAAVVSATPRTDGSEHVRLLVGTFNGTLELHDGATVRTTKSLIGPPRALLPLPDGRFLSHGERGGVAVVDPESLVQWPLLGSGVDQLVVVGDHWVTYGTDVIQWSVPPPAPFTQVAFDHGGLSSLNLSPNGASFTAGHGDGTLDLVDHQTGRSREIWTQPNNAAQLAAFLDDDHLVTYRDHILYRLDLNTAEAEPLGRWSGRTAATWGDDLVIDHWGLELSVVRDEVVRLLWPDPRDYVIHEGALWVVDDGGEITRASARQPLEPRFTVAGARRLAVTSTDVYVATADALSSYTHDGIRRWTLPLDRAPDALVAGPNHVVVSDMARSIHVFDPDGTPTHVMLEAHDRPIRHLMLEGDDLLTGGWDGLVKRWTLSYAGAPEQLHAKLGRAWAIPVEP